MFYIISGLEFSIKRLFFFGSAVFNGKTIFKHKVHNTCTALRSLALARQGRCWCSAGEAAKEDRS